MKSNIEESGAWERSIAVELEPDVVEERIGEVVRKVRRQIQLPGFRKGKVPIDVVEKKYWSTIEQEVLQSLVPEAVNEILREHEFRVASQPRVEDLHFERGEPLRFKAVVELWPDVAVPELSDIEIDEVLFETEEEDIDRVMEQFRDQAATLEPAGRPSQEGDVVEANLYPADRNGQRLPKGKRQELRIEAGGATLLPEFREVSLGIGEGEERLVHVRYPENHRDRNLAGSQRYYIFRPTRVLEKKRPSLDDSFAATVEDGLDLAGLRQKVREQIEAEDAKRARRMSQGQFLARVLDRIPVPVPEGAMEDALQHHMKRVFQQYPGADPEEVRREVEPQVQVMWQRRLILDSIARKEGMTISDEEVDAKIRERLGEGVNVNRVREQLIRSGEINGLRLEVLDDKVFRHVFEQVKVNQTTRPRPKAEQDSNIIVPE